MPPKSTKQTVTETAPAPAPTAVKSESQTPKVEKAKKPASKKPETAAPEPVVEAPVTTTTTTAAVVDTPVPTESVDQIAELEASIAATLKQLQEIQTAEATLAASRKASVKTLEKLTASLSKLSKKEIDKARRKKKSGQNSGFKKAVKVVPSFARMLGISPDETYPRGDVVKMLHSYIKSHSLQNPENRKEIIPDAALLDLFESKFREDIQKGVAQFTYFNFQKHIKHLFIKTA